MLEFLTGKLTVEKLTIQIANLPKRLQGIKLVQLSDLHYEGISLSRKLLTEAIAASNQVNPDLVVLTGDYINQKPSAVYHLVKELKHLQSRWGIYAILGNHDIEHPYSQQDITKAFNQIDIPVLWNEVVYPFGEGLALVGMADLYSGQFNHKAVFPQIPQEIPRIVLSHNPDTALTLKKWRVDLQLSGHTHGGQIIFPVLGPLPFLLQKVYPFIPPKTRMMIPYLVTYYTVVKHWQWYQGLHRIGDNLLYVNRGLGTYLPGRLYCNPEVTVITLT
jgi:predicted MPP superfamily phosphohydrolase